VVGKPPVLSADFTLRLSTDFGAVRTLRTHSRRSTAPPGPALVGTVAIRLRPTPGVQ